MNVVPAPDCSADVDLLTVDDSSVVKLPPRSVHELALVVPVEPLTREEVVLVPPGDGRGDVVQTLAVPGQEPRELSPRAGRPGGGSGAQLSEESLTDLWSVATFGPIMKSSGSQSRLELTPSWSTPRL